MLIQALNHFKFYFMIQIVVTHELLFMTRWLTMVLERLAACL